MTVAGSSAIADSPQLFQEQHPDQAENAIPLCPLCHYALDEISSLGWVSIPLRYFLDFECRDYKERRQKRKSTGAYIDRVSSSPCQNLQHQRKEVEEDSQGRLYTSHVLGHYIGQMLGLAQTQLGLPVYRVKVTNASPSGIHHERKTTSALVCFGKQQEGPLTTRSMMYAAQGVLDEAGVEKLIHLPHERSTSRVLLTMRSVLPPPQVGK